MGQHRTYVKVDRFTEIVQGLFSLMGYKDIKSDLVYVPLIQTERLEIVASLPDNKVTDCYPKLSKLKFYVAHGKGMHLEPLGTKTDSGTEDVLQYILENFIDRPIKEDWSVERMKKEYISMEENLFKPKIVEQIPIATEIKPRKKRERRQKLKEVKTENVDKVEVEQSLSYEDALKIYEKSLQAASSQTNILDVADFEWFKKRLPSIPEDKTKQAIIEYAKFKMSPRTSESYPNLKKKLQELLSS